ncbi:hypothetical protein PVAND_011966 [Polypedilum vanderplanki]|uniref:Uncharacterized protein n=1 Tax=Polypedilum vanderplanki TaxID=319348 RepID=A0A9J6CL12_POLVA|nr:hypothetical protein PVAND_011966 [Polypedilum vanderplanki]
MIKLAISLIFLCGLSYSEKIKTTTVDPFEKWFTFRKKEINIEATTTQISITLNDYDNEFMLADSNDNDDLEELFIEIQTTEDPFEEEFDKIFDDYEEIENINDFHKKYTDHPSNTKKKKTTKEPKNIAQSVIDDNLKNFQEAVLNSASFLDSIIQKVRNINLMKKF